MPHQRIRLLEAVIRKALTWSPSVGIIGMRQTGKTTLLRKIAKAYYSFDDDKAIGRFERSARGLLKKGPYPMGLDEIQKHPPVFDALKLIIDSHKRPGRFIVTGSVRFSSRKAVRESLTGRLAAFELFPLTLSEIWQKRSSNFLMQIQRLKGESLLKALQAGKWATEKMFSTYLIQGGLPGICFMRDSKVRDELFFGHLDTLFGRDVHLIRETRFSVSQLTDLVRLVAQNQGRPANYLAWARELNWSAPTVVQMLKALEGLCLVRPYGRCFFLEDQGLATFLRRDSGLSSRYDMIRVLYHEFRSQLGYNLRHEAKTTEYHTRGGIEIPFVISYKKGPPVAVAVDHDDIASDKSLKSITWWRRRQKEGFGIILCRGKDGYVVNETTTVVPWTWVV